MVKFVLAALISLVPQTVHAQEIAFRGVKVGIGMPRSVVLSSLERAGLSLETYDVTDSTLYFIRVGAGMTRQTLGSVAFKGGAVHGFSRIVIESAYNSEMLGQIREELINDFLDLVRGIPCTPTMFNTRSLGENSVHLFQRCGNVELRTTIDGDLRKRVSWSLNVDAPK